MNKPSLPLFLLALIPLSAYPEAAQSQKTSTKKGIGLTESKGFSEKQLKDLNVAWFYNWGAKTKISTHIPFIPMIFSKRTTDVELSADIILGFNEPDNLKQSNMSVQDALSEWPKVLSKGKRVGAPAMAGNPLTGDWFPIFMKANPRVDFITVHWYKGANSKKFIKDIETIFHHYKRPIWVTEFAPQTASSGRANPEKFPAQSVEDFMRETVQWMEQSAIVERYAWHDSKKGTSALFTENGDLTTLGRIYSTLP